ncbi:zinc ABC transporter substrate-binding protein [Arthrobacter sp. zg-Y820]|uniref:metal ABC transporter substrate-binding protein n=1 Tax=unclassified Arthrobacter TaxID=235627 RepID=UPI001E3C785F|nr:MULTISPECIES: zinc ABC transporter substrate-binding protein [unclassified Arthrobacter]MCC9196055.1 zinc ABC transporter substrate-binding protein [Arthrobacter sp. zg-Y820]MDK1278914.1 zinc ABC transporter substrate-binding protein [Arthrobacter sp. zg.Y820]WIB08672.1 zinc ABC transporter substrate-binding protein [Arthrobacter sp. zg-Y820]
MQRFSVRLAGVLLTGGALALTGCSASPDSDSAGTGEDTLDIVASTNVYGNIMETVGGDAVNVTSIIDRPSQDPHSYEASARDKLAVTDADLVVLNGGGFDTFMEQLVADAGIDSADVLNPVEISGLEDAETHDDGAGASPDASAESEGDDHDHDHGGHEHGSFNEHVWYSPEAMGLLAEAAAERLAVLDPDNASAYRDNAAEFEDGITDLTADLAEDKAAAGGRNVAVTEPVPEYLFEAAGLHNVTPADFTSAVEAGSDVPPAVLNELQELLRSGSIAFLAFNTQTATSQTEAVRTTAEEAGVPVLDFSETLPEGSDYLTWMGENVASIDDVLR